MALFGDTDLSISIYCLPQDKKNRHWVGLDLVSLEIYGDPRLSSAGRFSRHKPFFDRGGGGYGDSADQKTENGVLLTFTWPIKQFSLWSTITNRLGVTKSALQKKIIALNLFQRRFLTFGTVDSVVEAFITPPPFCDQLNLSIIYVRQVWRRALVAVWNV